MANIFKQQKDLNNKPKRNNFDLSFQNHLTMKMGVLYPVLCKEVVPGDSFRISSAFGLKFLPLAFPVQSKMRATMHYFYVRNKNLWDRWEDWISGLKTASDGVIHPYIWKRSNFFQTCKLADYLNVPTSNVDFGDASFVNVDTDEFVGVDYQDGFYMIDWSNYVGHSLTCFRPHLYETNNPNHILDWGIDFRYVAFYVKFDRHLDDYYLEPVDVQGGIYHYSVQFTSSFTGLSSITPGSIKICGFDANGYRYNDFQVDNVDYSNGNLTIAFQANDRFDHFTTTLAVFFDRNVIFPKDDFNSMSGVVTSARMLRLNNFSTTSEFVERTPFSSTEDAVRLNALPFRAHESIYNAYYRNSVNQPFRVNGQIEYNKYNTTVAGGQDDTDYQLYRRNYELDFLTSALPSPQQGNAPLVGMNALGQITLESEDGVTTAQAVIDESTGEITGLNVTSPIANKEHALTLQQIAQAGFTINSFRDTNALTRWLETNIRKGYRYLDFIAGHFGKSPKYSELDMPEFIGGFSRDVTVSQIVSTADTLGLEGGQGLGDFQGMANCFGGGNHSVTHYCDDYGFIVGILCVVPTPAYSQLLPKHFLKYSPLDYYFPEFSQLGMQPISYEEVCPVTAYLQSIADGGATSVHDTFGYQRPYYDLVSSVDEVHGLFRSESMRSFLINRIFGTRPVLGNDFLQIDPEETSQIFADQTDVDQIIGQVIFDIKAKRPIPRVVIPSLGRQCLTLNFKIMKYKNRLPKIKYCKLEEYEEQVQNGLALTPAQMMDLTNRGVPISPANLGVEYYEGVSVSDFEVPMEHRRGVDIADMWEHRQDMRSKLSSPQFKELLQGKEQLWQLVCYLAFLVNLPLLP